MKIQRRIFIRIIFILLIGGLIIHQLRFISDVSRRPSHSFVSYYTASYLLTQGKDAILFYNDPWFRYQVRQITPRIEEYYSPNPPITAFLLLPLVHHTHDDARVIWIGLNVLLVVGAVMGILWMEKVTFWRGGLALLIVLTYQPLWANFEYGQVYGLLFVMMALIWYAYAHQRDRLAGGLLGIIWITKTAGLLIFPLFLIKKRWQALASSILIMILIAVCTLPMLGGVATWQTYLNRLTEYNQRPSAAVTAYQSITGFFKHHLTYHATWSPSPLANLPMLATVLSFALMITLVVITFWKSRQDPSQKSTFCALIVLGVVISPVSVDYHFTVLLLPILLLLTGYRMSCWQVIGLLAAVGLLAIDYPYQNDIYNQTFLSLLAYPKLIGSLILWAVCVQSDGLGGFVTRSYQ